MEPADCAAEHADPLWFEVLVGGLIGSLFLLILVMIVAFVWLLIDEIRY